MLNKQKIVALSVTLSIENRPITGGRLLNFIILILFLDSL